MLSNYTITLTLDSEQQQIYEMKNDSFSGLNLVRLPWSMLLWAAMGKEAFFVAILKASVTSPQLPTSQRKKVPDRRLLKRVLKIMIKLLKCSYLQLMAFGRGVGKNCFL